MLKEEVREEKRGDNMTVTKTQKGRYFVIVSDATSVSDAVIELIDQLNKEHIPMSNVLRIDPTNKLVVYHL